MLNKQGPGKIDWTDFTLNIISGKCLYNCEYCYMHRFWRLGDNAKYQFKEHYMKCKMPDKPSRIFIGSSTDMFGSWINRDWIEKVLTFTKQNPEHTFQFLTKNPGRYYNHSLYRDINSWFGTTIDGLEFTKNNISLLLDSLPKNIIKFVSFEPLIRFPEITANQMMKLDWIIIGADSTRGAKKPPMIWADKLIQMANDCGVSVWVKDNYGYPETIKEFPKNK